MVLRYGLEGRGILLGQAFRQAREHNQKQGNKRYGATNEAEAAARCSNFANS